MGAEAKPPTDWSDWERYRAGVQHPASSIKQADLERAQENVKRYPWAQAYVDRLRASADTLVPRITPEYLVRMLERTTPGCVGPCPACRAKGLPWHPNGQWSWNEQTPDQLTCNICKTVFPNEEFPEDIVLQSKWDPEQKFTFVGQGPPFRCFGYNARPSLTGIIRARKVSQITSHLRTLAHAYALTQDARYARAARAILLRMAEVLPRYLVRAGYAYGEYADCDPHVAARQISNLPTDELVVPPNKPDRKLHTGYWSASRLGTSGMDGGLICTITEAYDLTCMAKEGDTPIFSDEDRVRIERDVLLEGAYLAACDPAINNKSVGNRAGAAMVGMCVGHPGLVHFGLDGFRRTVEEWFLPDGGTSESAAYAMMTMGGVRNFALMFRGYSDPPGYRGPDGTRLDNFDACRDTRYGDCWQGLVWTLQGDLFHPPSADSYRTTRINASFAELLALGYPTPEHIALLKELSGDEAPGSPQAAIFYREPGLEARSVPPLSLPDIVFPFLSQGNLRTGENGRKSLALLNASDWGGHHHMDSLDLYYWKDGHELLSDLGYLWDHPDSYQTRRTFAHNLVVVDRKDQKTRDRGGSFHLFGCTPRVKVMEASSRAYDAASTYRRTCIQVDHGDAGSYLVDLFRVEGGTERDYVFHGPGGDYQVTGLALAPDGQVEREVRFALRFPLARVGELYVADVEIRRVMPGEQEGPNLIAPILGEVGSQPAGWGYYSGDGTGDWGIAPSDEAGGRCMRVRALKPHENGRMNVALLAGKSDGYRGEGALSGSMGATYKARFRLRGNVSQVSVQAVYWPNDPKSPDDRSYVNIINAPVDEGWQHYEVTFTLPTSVLPLTDVQRAEGGNPWQITWSLEGDYTFAALAPGAPGETVRLGNGWGQRDHRNRDRGAVLPYVVRSSRGPKPVTFVTLFAGAPKGKLPVRGIRVLPLPADTPSDAIALAVETALGTDIVLSQLQPRVLRVTTPLGELVTDGLAAAVLADGQAPVTTALFGGTRLSLGAASVTIARGRYAGRVAGTGSARGEAWFVLDGELPKEGVRPGETLFIEADGMRRAYPIRRVAVVDGETRVYTKTEGTGFEARPGESWEILPSASWGR
ncbi:MAG: hypothetical protein GX785_16545 [Armatimonadetes bacterium]|nr:hypothetical protein [Armatimonadota bacterium]HPO72687.1 heparinase II/III family protein [Armatimonadota bacterium]